MIICSKLFKIKGIQIQVLVFPNGYLGNKTDYTGLVMFVWKTIHVSPNIESYSFYIEIKCESLDCSIKSLNTNSQNKQSAICQLSELKNLESICFDIIVNVKCIKYKKNCNKISYYSPINKMKNYLKFTWIFNDLLLKRCKKMYHKQPVYSQNFDNNNWCLVLFPNGKKDKGDKGHSCLFLRCFHFPQNVISMDIKVKMDCMGSIRDTHTKTVNFSRKWTIWRLSMRSMTFNELRQQESLSFVVTLEIINIHKENDVIIDRKDWDKLGILVNDSNEKMI